MRPRLNGDGRLRPDQRVAYLLLNALANRAPYRDVDAEVAIADFGCDDVEGGLAAMAGTPSPSRALSNLFWMHLPWDEMTRELGPLHVLDLGCGSGRYGELLARWSGGRIARYVGIDVQPHPDWRGRSAAHPFISFARGDIQQLDTLIPPDTNVIVSQSTIEHVADDRRAFDQLHEFVRRVRPRPVLQAHLVPSAACLRTYLWHGYRQYTPRTLSALTRGFAEDSDRLIVRLGGAACNALHARMITWPVLVRRVADPRDQRPDEYRRAVLDAIVRDMRKPQSSPAFYAVLIRRKGTVPIMKM